LAASDVDRIFEPYEQVGPGRAAPIGVGIGLYVSRLLARLMGGKLECTRQNGLTCFNLTLSSVEAVAGHDDGDRDAVTV
jgi:signal transduction histidine kinase